MSTGNLTDTNTLPDTLTPCKSPKIIKAEVVSSPGQTLNAFWPKASFDAALGWDTEGSVSLHYDESTLPQIVTGSTTVIIQPTKAGWGEPCKELISGYIEKPFRRAFLLSNNEGSVTAMTTTTVYGTSTLSPTTDSTTTTNVPTTYIT